MCGIIGILNREKASELVIKGLGQLKHRGKDGFGITNLKEVWFEEKLTSLKDIKADDAIGHCLHSIVNFIPQPIIYKDMLSSNCEIYNWKELTKKYRFNAGNDSEFLLQFLQKKGIRYLDELDGVYAFSYLKDRILYLARDIIGLKPLWYSHSQGFAFASEKKALESLGYLDIVELNPRKILTYDLNDERIGFIERKFFEILPENKKKIADIRKDLKKYLIKAIEKRLPDKKFGLLFSGGIDSTIIALICKELKRDFICYTAALDDKEMKEPEDLLYAKKAAKDLGLNLKIRRIKLENVDDHLKRIIPLIEDSNVIKAGVALTFFVACEQARKDNIKVIFSGLGSEEIFGGYQRHKASDQINKECVSGLLKMYERDLYRDDVVTMYNYQELRIPFLDHDLVDFSLKIPEKYKIKEGHGKHILRQLAEEMGLKKEFAWRKKKAAQYGSNFDKAIAKMTKKHGYKYKSEYMKQFLPANSLKLGVLCSGGKDSLYSAFVMKRQNYDLNCLITMKSRNPDSYMFHTPNVNLVRLQAKAMDIPLVEQETKGMKEEELIDLEKALIIAKNKHNIQGITTGALYSNYQRERIEKICDRLSLKVFSPLWHINQETLMQELIQNGFEVILSSVAADGLDKNWLGKRLDDKMIADLIKINKRIGINVAFEGGEAESLVLDCPLFKKKIRVIKSEMIEESEHVARLDIVDAKLVEKD